MSMLLGSPDVLKKRRLEADVDREETVSLPGLELGVGASGLASDRQQ